ncbi:MAG: FkbM family methyltransferase [Rhodospirillaceae bacterium]
MNILAFTARQCCYHMPADSLKWRLADMLERRLSSAQLPGKAVTRLPSGFSMKLDLADFIQRTIYITGHWEPTIEREIEACLGPGDIFIDIGANVGYFSLLAARLVGTRGQVLAFEPNPQIFNALLSNISINQRLAVSAYQMALGNQQTTAELFVAKPGNSGATSLTRSPSTTDQAEIVPVERLDTVLSRLNVACPRLIKIDVEGSEVSVLEGMGDLLAGLWAPVIICEISEYSLAQQGHSKEDIFDIMRRFGYKARLLPPVGVSTFSDTGVYLQYNVIFQKKPFD